MSSGEGFEYRVCWSASSNINFRGATEWQEWWGIDEQTPAEVESTLCDFTGTSPPALDEMIDASGLDWHVEVRRQEKDTPND